MTARRNWGAATRAETRLLVSAAMLTGAVQLAAQSQAPARPADPQPPATETAAPAQPARPTFRASTELIAIDATVVDDHGEPIADLTPEDFTLSIDGTPRRVVSAQFIRQEPPGPPPTLAGRKLPFSTNEGAVGGRLVLIVFDLEGIAPGGGRGVTKAASDFLDALSPADRVGVLSLPSGSSVDFTTDREKVRQTLSKVVGRGTFFTDGIYNVGLSEALNINRNDSRALADVVSRECAAERTPEGVQMCQTSVESQARGISVTTLHRAANTLQSLRALLVTLAKIDGTKTMVWISEGLALGEVRAEVGGLSAMAAAARTTIYSLHLDQTAVVDASRMRASPSVFQDRQIESEGLASIAGATRGQLFTAIGTGANVFARIAREMTAYYLLSAEPLEADRDGKAHKIKLAVNRKDVSVRARNEFSMRKESAPVSPQQRLAGVLSQPMVATELPIKVATYNLRKPGSAGVKVVVTAEFGNNALEGQEASIAYVILTDKGKVVGSSFSTNKATLVRKDVPGPLQATTMVEVPPGKYTMRLGVLDADGRAGSVEHPFTAELTASGDLEVADMLLAPVNVSGADAVRLIADPTIDTEPFGAYLELYPRSEDVIRRTSVKIEVAENEAAPAIGATIATLGPSSEKGRFVAQGMLPLGLVPPGEYVARAVVTTGGHTTTLLRAFRLARAVPAGDVFKKAMAARVGTFSPAQVLTPALLAPALAQARELNDGPASPAASQLADEVAQGRMDGVDWSAVKTDASLTGTFLRGLDHYRAGKLEDAAKDFRAAVRLSSDFLPGIFYLGACYAAGGRGREAVGAWQTSLIGDDSTPEVFELLIDGFLRVDDVDAAIGAIDEAAAKWPDDYRFVLRATLAQAAQDKPAKALAQLRPWLEKKPGDQEALDLALQLALADLATRPPGEEQEAVAQLKDLTARYDAAGTPVPAVAARWLSYLATKSPTQ